jgi:hypothetical protein
MRFQEKDDGTVSGFKNYIYLFNLPSWCAQFFGLISPLFLIICGIILCSLPNSLPVKQVFQIIYIIFGSLYGLVVLVYMSISCCFQFVSCVRLYGWLEREGMNSSFGMLINNCGYCLHILNSMFSLIVVATFVTGGITLATNVATSMTIGIISICIGAFAVFYACISCCVVIFPITSYVCLYICCCISEQEN